MSTTPEPLDAEQSERETLEAFYAEHYADWTVHELPVMVYVPTKRGTRDESLALVREVLDDATLDIKMVVGRSPRPAKAALPHLTTQPADVDRMVREAEERLVDRIALRIMTATLPEDVWARPNVKAWFVEGVRLAAEVARSVRDEGGDDE